MLQGGGEGWESEVLAHAGARIHSRSSSAHPGPSAASFGRSRSVLHCRVAARMPIRVGEHDQRVLALASGDRLRDTDGLPFPPRASTIRPCTHP